MHMVSSCIWARVVISLTDCTVHSILGSTTCRWIKRGFSQCSLWLGVTVKSGSQDFEVWAPVIISNAGMFTTFKKLLPPEVQANRSKWMNVFNASGTRFQFLLTWETALLAWFFWGNLCICFSQRSKTIFILWNQAKDFSRCLQALMQLWKTWASPQTTCDYIRAITWMKCRRPLLSISFLCLKVSL